MILQDTVAQGKFSLEERTWSINTKETIAVLLGLQSFKGCLQNHHTLVLCDNKTAVHIIREMGTMSNLLRDRFVREIEIWCFTCQIDSWIMISWILGKENVKADDMSQIFKETTEWALPQRTYGTMMSQMGIPRIDLFTSCINFKTKPFISCCPDPKEQQIIAFTRSWKDFHLRYVFPPFSLIPRMLKKIREEHA